MDNPQKTIDDQINSDPRAAIQAEPVSARADHAQRQGLYWHAFTLSIFLCLLTNLLADARADEGSKHAGNPEKDTSDAKMAGSLVNDYQAGRYREALEMANKMLKVNPRDHAVRLMVGNIYARLGQYSYAQAEYEGVINSAPESKQARYARAALAKLAPEPSISPSTVSAVNNQDARNETADINEVHRIMEERDREIEQKRKNLAVRIDHLWQDFDNYYPGMRAYYANGQSGIIPMPVMTLRQVKADLDKKIEDATADIQKQIKEINQTAEKKLSAY